MKKTLYLLILSAMLLSCAKKTIEDADIVNVSTTEKALFQNNETKKVTNQNKFLSGVYTVPYSTDYYEINTSGNIPKLKYGFVDPIDYKTQYSKNKITTAYSKQDPTTTDLLVLQSNEWLEMLPIEIDKKNYYFVKELNTYFYVDESGHLYTYIFKNNEPVDEEHYLSYLEKDNPYGGVVPKAKGLPLKELLKIQKEQ